jgi:transposase
MSQIQLPLFPAGVTPIADVLAFGKEAGRVTYFNGSLPVFGHAEDDSASFRRIAAQCCIHGNAKQAEIARTFGVPKIGLKRAVRRYRETGPKGFDAPRVGRGPAVLTPEVLAEAQQRRDAGGETADVADELGVKRDTRSKAVRAGRLHQPEKKALARR